MGLAKNRENVEYLVKIFPTGQIPLSDFFYKIKGGEDVRVCRPYTYAKFHRSHS